MTKEESCEEFKAQLRRLRTTGRKRMKRGYRKDPKEYKETTLDAED